MNFVSSTVQMQKLTANSAPYPHMCTMACCGADSCTYSGVGAEKTDTATGASVGVLKTGANSSEADAKDNKY